MPAPIAVALLEDGGWEALVVVGGVVEDAEVEVCALWDDTLV